MRTFPNPDSSRFRVAEFVSGSASEDGYPGLVPLEYGPGTGPKFTRAIVEDIARDYEGDDCDDTPDSRLIFSWSGDVLQLESSGERVRIEPDVDGLYDFGRLSSIGSHVWEWKEFWPPWPDHLTPRGRGRQCSARLIGRTGS